jgi:hypothetical protein
MNKNITPIIVGVAVVVALGFLVLRPKAPQGRAVDVLAAIDVSDSTRLPLPGGGHLMGRSIELLARVGTRLDYSRDHLTIFRVERETREFYDDLAPRSREKFQWFLIRHTKPAPAHSGTFPARFWTQAAARAARASEPVAVVYLGDADNDDLTPASRDEMSRAAQQLASNAQVREVSIYGANPKNWETLRQVFAPLDAKGILHLHASDEMAVKPLMEEIEAMRHAGEAGGKSSS